MDFDDLLVRWLDLFSFPGRKLIEVELRAVVRPFISDILHKFTRIVFRFAISRTEILGFYFMSRVPATEVTGVELLVAFG